MATDLLIGQTLGAYRITRLLKRTGMSMVYLARDDKLERDVVAKVMLPAHSDDESFAARFHQEALATARLSHPNIIHIYDFGRHDDLYYMVMEYLPGGSLYDRLVDASVTGRRVDMAQALHIVSLMAQALDHAHRAGFVHRDVKPSNILFSQDGHPVLTDLGIVKTREGPHLTESLLSVGTPEYMSPEQGRGDPVDARSDIYSLGVVLYELLAGTLPFRAETTWGLIYKHLYEAPPPLQNLNRSVSPALRSVVEKALAKRPEDRFQTARELADALERAQAAPGRRLYPPPPPPPPPDAGEDAPESAAADKPRHRSRGTPRPGEPRTDRVVIPGRGVTRPGSVSTARRGSGMPWLLGIAAALLMGAVVLVATGAVDLRGTRSAAQPAPAATVAPQATASSALAAVPTAIRTPGSSQPATVRTAAPVATFATSPSATAPRSVATARVGNVKAFPTVMLSAAEGAPVALAAYLDPEGRYGLYVPATWWRTNDGLGVSFEAPDRMARILVHEVRDTTSGESGAAIARRYVEGAQAVLQEIREVDNADGSVGELAAFEQQLDAKLSNIPVKARLLAVNAGETGIVVVGAASAASEPTYRPVLAAVLDSFRISGAPVPPSASLATRASPTVAQAVSQAPTLAPTFTRPPAATRVPPTATRPPAQPTAAAAPRATPRPAGGLPAAVLLSPADNASLSGQAIFAWRWDGPALAANQGFEVRIWKADQPVHYGAAEPTNNTSLAINLPAAYGVSQGGSGAYFWTVAVVQRKPYQQVGPEAAPRPLQVQVGGGGGGGSAPTHEPPPP